MQASPRDYITVVSGLPRSGTSLMMQMLAAGGVPPLTDNLRAPDENNPHGYFEFDPVKRLRTDQSWLEQARGHAVKIIHLLVRELPTNDRFRYRVILMRRAMEEILASQRVMLERQGKKSADEAALARIYKAQLSGLTDWLEAHGEFSFLSINYRQLLENPGPVIRSIDNFLGGGLNVAAMASAVDPALYRQRANPDG
jgi:LPS sulfotransferase NodH